MIDWLRSFVKSNLALVGLLRVLLPGLGVPTCSPTPKSIRSSRKYVAILWVRNIIPDPRVEQGYI